jgi:hypothetical protein
VRQLIGEFATMLGTEEVAIVQAEAKSDDNA